MCIKGFGRVVNGTPGTRDVTALLLAPLALHELGSVVELEISTTGAGAGENGLGPNLRVEFLHLPLGERKVVPRSGPSLAFESNTVAHLVAPFRSKLYQYLK